MTDNGISRASAKVALVTYRVPAHDTQFPSSASITIIVPPHMLKQRRMIKVTYD